MKTSWLAFSTGFAVCASLIIAIGAQNAFLLRQAIRNQFVIPIVLLFVGSDALLLTSGVAGGSAALGAIPWLVPLAKWLGVGFLATYGASALRRAFSPDGLVAAPTGEGASAGAGAVLGAALGFTYLNPHVYLDTVLLIGSIGATQPTAGKLPFVLGAACASATWFTLLGAGGRLLAPLFARPAAWRVIEATTAATMFVTARALLRG
jgi:L-lysine exporter family protein LysE/ArgO